MQRHLISFVDVYEVEEFDNKPLPVNVYNSAGAAMASKASTLTLQRLYHSYVYVDELPQDIIKLKNLQALLKEEEKPQVKIEKHKAFALSEEYREDPPELLEQKLDDLDFEPFKEVKSQLRRNIHQMGEIFQKKIVDNVIHLSSANNQKISMHIAGYFDLLSEDNLFATEYIDMIREIRSKDNYITFSHATSVAFYTASIAKKLKMLQEDMLIRKNMGKWLTVKTKKNKFKGIASFSNQLLKYIDAQKLNIMMKYPDKRVQEKLIEELNDIMHLYIDIKNNPIHSLTASYDDQHRKFLTVAALNSDLGKLCIPNNILNKKEELTEAEWKEMRKHPIYSIKKLKEIADYPTKILAYILGHHNIGNKKGYPILKQNLPNESMVLTICDMYDAMIAPRHYGKQYSHDEAMELIKALYQIKAIDLPLFAAASHTFHEYNHNYTHMRVKTRINRISAKA